MTSGSKRNRARPGVRLPLWALIIIVVLVLSLFAGSTVWLYRTVYSMASTLEMSNPDFGPVAEPVPGAAVTVGESTDNQVEEPAPLISTDALKAWPGKERITILLLGIDQRCEEDGPTHTDSMMVLTIDPVAMSAGVLSLPRDLWVEIPEFGVDRINQAHYLGQAYEYPGGGPVLAMETVAANLGIPIDYYATVNFDAFVQVVDLIDGVTIDVPEPIDDPTYPDRCYGYDPFQIDAGEQHMDGATALKYARTRVTFGGDVDRAGRQQDVILAVRDKVLRLNMLPQLMTQSARLWQTLQDNVRTNLSLDEALQLALLVQDIPRDNIKTAVIDYNNVYNETTPDGRQVLVPNREEIRKLRDQLFAPAAVPTPTIEELPERMAAEEAEIALYNGTAVFGLAAATEEHLIQLDFDIVEIGNADSASYRTTQIIDYGSHPYTTQYLTQIMNVPPLNVSTGTKPAGDFDVLVIIGDDWRVPEP